MEIELFLQSQYPSIVTVSLFFFLCYLLTVIVNKENLNKPESLGLFSFKYIKHLLYEVLDAKCCVSVSIPPPTQPASHLHTIHYLLS